MYSMKEVCALTNMTYENLKFYCNEGLVPNVKRDRRNYRLFDEHDIKWIQSLGCLKNCGMSIAEMKEYLALCLKGGGIFDPGAQGHSCGKKRSPAPVHCRTAGCSCLHRLEAGFL